MYAAFDSLLQRLDQFGVKYMSDAASQSVAACFAGNNGNYQLIATIDGDDDLLQVFGLVPVTVPPGCRSDVAEAITRMNCGLKVGKFEMDFDHGNLRFQAATVLEKTEISEALVGRLISTALMMLERYVPATMSVIYGNEAPADAVRRVEMA